MSYVEKHARFPASLYEKTGRTGLWFEPFITQRFRNPSGLILQWTCCESVQRISHVSTTCESTTKVVEVAEKVPHQFGPTR